MPLTKTAVEPCGFSFVVRVREIRDGRTDRSTAGDKAGAPAVRSLDQPGRAVYQQASGQPSRSGNGRGNYQIGFEL
jgi:hypothetical protein